MIPNLKGRYFCPDQLRLAGKFVHPFSCIAMLSYYIPNKLPKYNII